MYQIATMRTCRFVRGFGKPTIDCMDDAVGRVNIRSSREGEALNAFRGLHTLYRVVPVVVRRERMVAIFSFYDRSGVAMMAKDLLGFTE